jgi:putative spermidine/putrescine transport system permease protein
VNRTVGSLTVAVFVCCVFLPLVVVLIASLASELYFTFPPNSISGAAYVALFRDPTWYVPLLHTAVIASLVAVTTTVAAAMFAGTARVATISIRWSILGSLTVVGFVPPTVIAVAVALLAGRLSATNTYVAVVLGESLLATPLCTLLLYAYVFRDPLVPERVARLCGAPWPLLIRWIAVPRQWRRLLASAALAFAIALDDTVVATYAGGIRTETLATRVWAALRYDFDHTVAAVAVVIALASLALSRALLAARSEGGPR